MGGGGDVCLVNIFGGEGTPHFRPEFDKYLCTAFRMAKFSGGFRVFREARGQRRAFDEAIGTLVRGIDDDKAKLTCCVFNEGRLSLLNKRFIFRISINI